MGSEHKRTVSQSPQHSSQDVWRISKSKLYRGLSLLLASVMMILLTSVQGATASNSERPLYTFSCPNGVCETNAGETPTNCPLDCSAGDGTEEDGKKKKVEIAGCDGGKEPHRWNTIARMWERDFCRWLFDVVPTNDPFDAVFGYQPDAFHWNYSEAIVYLMSQGFSQSQLDTFEEQIQALVTLGLWDPDTQSIPEGADLSFLSSPPDDPGFLSWLPRR